MLARYEFTDYRVRLSLRGEAASSSGRREMVERATNGACGRPGLPRRGLLREAVGEAAFYGPKADFMARDVLGREWQLSTIQVDFIQPARLGCDVHRRGRPEHTPVVLHRAVTGTTERFMGVIIEHFAGAFPLWLSPVQAMHHPHS